MYCRLRSNKSKSVVVAHTIVPIIATFGRIISCFSHEAESCIEYLTIVHTTYDKSEKSGVHASIVNCLSLIKLKRVQNKY